MTIKTFAAEKLDGLEERIIASNKMAMACQIVNNLDYRGDERVIASLPSNPDQQDLYYLNAILVSTGWNKNDDVFAPESLWAAKDTPVNKQLNMMHDDNDIIGHMTGSTVVDFDGNIITEQTDEFDIAISAVIYRFRSDADVRESVATLIQEIEENKWAVSMECLFNGFDYAIIRPDGHRHVVARDESSAFLTKHLRAYGGTGKYKDWTIGRSLRDITFSGIGIVDNPAGPRSEILKRDVNPFLDVTPITVAALNTVANNVNDSDEEKNIMTIEQLQAELQAVKAELAESRKALADATAAAETAKAEAVAKKEAELTSAAETAKANSAAKDEIIEALKADVAQAETDRDEVKEALKASEEALEAEKANTKQVERRSQLVEAGVKDADIDAKLEKFGSASDEVFASVVELLKEAQAKFPFKKDDDKKDEKKDDSKAEDESEAGEAAADTDVDPETTSASMNSDDDDTEDERAALRAEIAEFAKAALTR